MIFNLVLDIFQASFSTPPRPLLHSQLGSQLLVLLLHGSQGLFGLSHCFKNRTGPTCSTGNRPSIRSGYSKKSEIALKPINSENRPIQPENRKPERSDQFCKIAKTLKQICNGAFFAVKIFFFFSDLLMVRTDFCNKVFFLKIGYA